LLLFSAESLVFQFAIQKCKNLDIETGSETCSVILRQECSLRVSENRVLRGIFGPKRDEVTGEWRKLNNEELNDLYCSPNIVWVRKSRRMK